MCGFGLKALEVRQGEALKEHQRLIGDRCPHIPTGARAVALTARTTARFRRRVPHGGPSRTSRSFSASRTVPSSTALCWTNFLQRHRFDPEALTTIDGNLSETMLPTKEPP